MTERTKFWRSRELDDRDSRTLDRIEQYSCEIEHIGKDENDGSVGFSYTCGLFDTTGMPEIIVIGLKTNTAHSLLNEAARRHQQGIDLTEAPQEDLIGNVSCVFRPVAQKWKEHLMRFDGWYHDHWDFPALQAIYPDLNGRFQWDEDAEGKEPFQEYFRQPLLQPNVEETIKEKDLWAENDPTSSLFNWKFPDPPHTLALVTDEVNEGREDVTFVNHCPDDEGWEFVGDTEGGDFKMVCLHHPIDSDDTLKELADLPKGWNAVRATKGDEWLRRPMNLEDKREES